MLIAEGEWNSITYNTEKEWVGMGLIQAQKAKFLEDEINNVTH